jgi:cell filamentation protein
VIDRKIFGDIYGWAGQIRTVAIAKGSLFCLPQYIETAAAEIGDAEPMRKMLNTLVSDGI